MSEEGSLVYSVRAFAQAFHVDGQKLKQLWPFSRFDQAEGGSGLVEHAEIDVEGK